MDPQYCTRVLGRDYRHYLVVYHGGSGYWTILDLDLNIIHKVR